MFSRITEQEFFFLSNKAEIERPFALGNVLNFLICDRNNNPIHANAVKKHVGHCYEKKADQRSGGG